MTLTFQSVIKVFPNVTQKISKKVLLSVELFLRTSERKNASSLARYNNLPYRNVYLTSQEAEDCIEYGKKSLVDLINNLATQGVKGTLLIDFTNVLKPYSQKTSDVTYDYSGCSKRIEKGFSLGFAVWSNGTICIPFDFESWLRKKDAGNAYKTKIELAKDLINSAKQVIPFKEVMLDGAFASQEMIQFLMESGLHFTMRIPCNRVINVGRQSFQLRHCPRFRFKRNEKFKTIWASYKGFYCYFTAHKRKTKNNNCEIVFIISNVKRTSREHVIAYKQRWPQEKFHRTAKQKLGLQDCQSTSRIKQHAHTFLVMMTYSQLELMKIYKWKKSPEEIVNLFRHQKSPKDLRDLHDLEETFMV